MAVFQVTAGIVPVSVTSLEAAEPPFHACMVYIVVDGVPVSKTVTGEILPPCVLPLFIIRCALVPRVMALPAARSEMLNKYICVPEKAPELITNLFAAITSQF